VGTLIGAIAYLRKDVKRIIVSLCKSLKTRKLDWDSKFGLLLLVSAIPGAILGALFDDTISNHLSGTVLVALMLIVFGVVLYGADRIHGHRTSDGFTMRDAIFAGCAQAAALVPGVSRSGATMSLLRARQFTREESARLSFLMLLPIVGGAAVFTSAKTLTGDGFPHNIIMPMVAGVIASAIVGFFAVFGLLKLLQTKSFTPFVIYRILAGVGVLIWFATK
jgi:undecaprenyl-diphosphatase